MSKRESSGPSRRNGAVPPRSSKRATGKGGELHQASGGRHSPLTANPGRSVSDSQNSLRANSRGPTLLEDFIRREKITHFDHECIPERIVHARSRLLRKAGAEPDAGVVDTNDAGAFIAAASTRQCNREASVRTLACRQGHPGPCDNRSIGLMWPWGATWGTI